ncbi:hypothetical protein Pmar_PMAR020472 [Perkinsus marinus ATCC 50983]|uniref:Uncharacterized protein n=1 Tax=Perkinsus marinus (strain ATCC 50983 / TXsc) TaxID=423536 RepID=C5L747_PERM5|nr:hypothetical protein Pmar_PMAR020472 [Perkinsus marinus ATCC 50983]EER07309.1 hypothetical protein Pmar_PMAR020472 [Perkinsus marinus ATCC 50983]|eukprot:XP_002775493.1 hypothetical protein Pmar_PMAR020472 [Perkinsus marinus ATCC 50983]
MTTPSLDNRTRITSVSIDHGALGLVNEERLKSRLASSFGLLTQGRLPHVVGAAVVAGAVAYAARELYNLRQQASTLRKQLQEAHNKLGEKESELHQKTEELELLHKKWQGAARMLLSRAVVANEMQETKTSSPSGTESTSHPRGVASRLVTAATGSGATRVAAAAAMMWLLRLRISAGGSLQLRGGPHIKAKFGVSRPL